jgi:citrate synthase
MSNVSNATIDLSQYPYINKGLEGIMAFTTGKSSIDGQKGELIYAGYNINELAEYATFEEVCFLLWNERLPKAEELSNLEKELAAHRKLAPEVLKYISSTPTDAEPMAVLRTAVSMLSNFDMDKSDNSLETNKSKVIRITAKIPTIIAAFDRHRDGKNILEPLSDHSTAYNFLYMLNGEHPGENAEKVMDLCLILHAEHGMNASTFTTRVVCSTLSDMYSAITAAIGSLKGPLHGGANTAVMNMLLEMDENTDVREFILGKLARKEKIMGFGHRVYKTIDPRARLLRKMAKDLAEEVDMLYLYEWSEAILETMKSEKNIDPNVDFFSATVYYSAGIKPDLYTCIFAMSRVSGWTAHFLEQLENNRLIRPIAMYTGEKNLPWKPVEDR